MNKKYFRVGVMLALAVLLAPGTGRAESQEAAPDSPRAWKKDLTAVYAGIGLTPDQEKALTANRGAYRLKMKNIHSAISAKQEEIRAELQKTRFDAGRVRQLHEELKALKAGKEDARLEGILAVRDILTAEQFGRFLELKEHKRGFKPKMNRKE